AHFRMLREQVQEIIAPDESYLAGAERFRRDLVASLGKNGHETEDFAGLGDAQDQGSARAGTDGELHFAGTKHEYSVWVLLLEKEHSAARIGGRGMYVVEIHQSPGLKLTEKARCAQSAVLTAVDRFESVRSAHGQSPFFRWVVDRVTLSAKCLVSG